MAFNSLLALLTVSTRLDPLLSTPMIGLAGDNATQARCSAPPPYNSSLAAAAATVSSGVAFPAEFVAHGTQWTREPAMGLISRTCSLDGMMGALKQSQWAKPSATLWYFIDAAIRFIEELVAFNAFNRDKDGALSVLAVLHWFLTNPRLWLFVVTSAGHVFIISCTKILRIVARAANRRRKKTEVVLPAAGAATEGEAASAEVASAEAASAEAASAGAVAEPTNVEIGISIVDVIELAAGERLAGILRVRGGMGAGASALTDESPDADIKAAYEGASAQERSVFLVDVGEQDKRKLMSLGLDVSEAAPSGLTPGTPLPSDVDRSIAALERSLALNRARQRDLRDEEAAICSQLQELRSSAKQAAKDAAEAPPKLRQALTELDKIVIQVLLCGAIRLICVKWLLMQPANFKMPNRQALEEIERSRALPSPLLSPQEAAALVRRGDRSIGTLTYGWLSPGDPDPDGSRIRVLRRALMGMAIRIEALFWDFGSLYQAPRTPEQSASFKLALEGGAMNQLYASILATTVLQIEEIPPRPAEFDGVVCLFKLSANVDESVVRAALVGFGTIESCDLSHSPPIVRFASHASAVAAKDAGAWPGLCEGLDTLYNETPYFSRGW
jgi:hypothetical protein